MKHQARAKLWQPLPGNELGFSMCRVPSGRIVPGPVAHGSPTNVNIPVECPSGSTFVGLFHTHPKGMARPSGPDLSEAERVGARYLCVANDTDMRCQEAP